MYDVDQMAKILIALGGLFVIGLVADLLSHRTPLPRVTILIVAGIVLGPSGLDWLPVSLIDLFPLLTAIALAMVGFLLGQQLTRSQLRDVGRAVMGISIGVVLVTTTIVAVGLALVGAPWQLALVLGGIATATDPAATADVVRESRATGNFPKTLLGVVAIDDAWGLLVFSLLLAIAQSLGQDSATLASLVHGIREIGGAIVVGLALGLPLAFLTGRVEDGEPTQAEALGCVILTAGISVWIDVSYILSSIVLGVTVASLAKHHTRPFHAIEGIEWPFLIIFFFLAGASLDIASLRSIGLLGAGYVVLRVLGRAVGGRVGGAAAGADTLTCRWIGVALLPQAGVAVGLALLASQRLPQYADQILPVVVTTTVVFELFGPILTRVALHNSQA